MTGATFSEYVVTARKRRAKEKTISRIRFEAANGLLVQCPRAWRERVKPGARFRILAHVRADGACLVAYPSHDPEPIP